MGAKVGFKSLIIFFFGMIDLRYNKIKKYKMGFVLAIPPRPIHKCGFRINNLQQSEIASVVNYGGYILELGVRPAGCKVSRKHETLGEVDR